MMREYVVKLIVRVLRWVVVNLLISPLIKKYLEVPLIGLLMKIFGGIVPEDDLESGGGASAGVLASSAMDEDPPV